MRLGRPGDGDDSGDGIALSNTGSTAASRSPLVLDREGGTLGCTPNLVCLSLTGVAFQLLAAFHYNVTSEIGSETKKRKGLKLL